MSLRQETKSVRNEAMSRKTVNEMKFYGSRQSNRITKQGITHFFAESTKAAFSFFASGTTLVEGIHAR
jgi:hypothetical protein